MHRVLEFLNQSSTALIVEENHVLDRTSIRAAVSRCRDHLKGQEGTLAIEGRAGIHFMVWVYAAWSEGLCVLPIDQSLPEQEKDFLLQWADAGHVHCERPLPDGPGREMSVFAWDESSDAMILFTSGSTGQPKGLRFSAKSLLADLDIRQTTHESSIFWASIAYSQSAYALVTYALGHTVLCVSRETWLDLPRIEALVERWDIRRIFCTPSYAREATWLENVDLNVSLYGEQATPDLLNRSNVTDCYGQTEAPSLWFALRQSQEDWVCDTTADIALLDEEGEEIHGIGIPGRLCIRNRVYLATVYLDGTSLSDPYDTGDWAEWTEPGRFVLKGRSDQMVKLRGFRVNLSGVEAAIRLCSDVTSAAVVLRDQNLMAYVSPRCADIESIKRSLADHIPDHEIPTRWLTLDELPLNANHKVDRRALPEIVPDATYRAPQTPSEIEMCRDWAEVLACDRVGMDDDFFALGGHSLLALRLARLTGYAVGVILAHPTPAELLSQPLQSPYRSTEFSPPTSFTFNSFIDSLRWYGAVPWQPRWESRWLRWGFGLVSLADSETARIWLELFIGQVSLRSESTQMIPRLERLFAQHPILAARINCRGDLLIDRQSDPSDHFVADPVQLSRLKNRMIGLYDRPLALAILGSEEATLILHHAIFDNRTLQVIEEDWETICQGGVLPDPADVHVFEALLGSKPETYRGPTGLEFREVDCCRISGPAIAEHEVWSSVVRPIVDKLVQHFGKEGQPAYFQLVRDLRFEQEDFDATNLCGPLTADQVYRAHEGRIEKTQYVGMEAASFVWINIIRGEPPENLSPVRWRQSGSIYILVQMGRNEVSWSGPTICLPEGHAPIPGQRGLIRRSRRRLAESLRRRLFR